MNCTTMLRHVRISSNELSKSLLAVNLQLPGLKNSGSGSVVSPRLVQADLTPVPSSLIKVLPYIRARVAFNTGPCQLPYHLIMNRSWSTDVKELIKILNKKSHTKMFKINCIFFHNRIIKHFEIQQSLCEFVKDRGKNNPSRIFNGVVKG